MMFMAFAAIMLSGMFAAWFSHGDRRLGIDACPYKIRSEVIDSFSRRSKTCPSDLTHAEALLTARETHWRSQKQETEAICLLFLTTIFINQNQ